MDFSVHKEVLGLDQLQGACARECLGIAKKWSFWHPSPSCFSPFCGSIRLGLDGQIVAAGAIAVGIGGGGGERSVAKLGLDIGDVGAAG